MTINLAACLRTRYVVAGLTLFCMFASGPAAAQSRKPPVKKERKWTVEVFGGGAFGSGPSSGGGTQFPAGEGFNTVGPFPSRANSSWYFGDGSTLFNEVNAQFASRYNVQYPRIQALDGMLSAAALRRRNAPSFGVRLTRRLTARFGIEFGLQRTAGKFQLREGARNAVEASRGSFENAFRGLINTAPVTNLQVSSTATIPDSTTASQTTISGVVNIALVKMGRVAAHASAGVGRVNNGGTGVTVRLRGNYQFRLLDTFPFNEADNVTIRLTDRDDAVIGVLGGGMTYDLSARQALRLDARVHAGESGMTTVIDATPTIAPGTSLTQLPSITDPSIQFSNNPNIRSSLNGTTTGLNTFRSDGLDTRVLITVAYVLRF